MNTVGRALDVLILSSSKAGDAGLTKFARLDTTVTVM